MRIINEAKIMGASEGLDFTHRMHSLTMGVDCKVRRG